MLISNTSQLDLDLEQAGAPTPRAGGTLFALMLILAVLAANAGIPSVATDPVVVSQPAAGDARG